jgi:methionine-gamma-lyase
MLEHQLFPTFHLDSFERRIAALDGTERGALFSSDIAAISTAMLALLLPGDHVVATEPLPRTTRRLLEEAGLRFGIKASFVPAGTDAVAAIREEAASIKADRLRMILVQTPADPSNVQVDLQGVAHLADWLSFRRDRRIVTLIDNTLLGPIHQKPSQHGCDLVFHGELGTITGPASLIDPIADMRSVLGTSAIPFTGWLLSNVLDTMPARMERQTQTATRIARALSNHRAVESVHHLSQLDPSDPQHDIMLRQTTGVGSMISFELKGGPLEACKVLARVEKARIDHPLKGWLRLRVGLEEPDELERDLLQALEVVRPMAEPKEDLRTTQITRVPII